jgi:hypothetical protein
MKKIKMRGYQIALIVSIGIFVVGIILTLFFNTLFLFLFLPIGFGWSFWRRGARTPASENQSTNTGYSGISGYSAGSQFCTFCGTRLVAGNLFCPNCGRPVSRGISYEDLR